MSIFNWLNKIFGIEDSKTQFGLPSEFQLPTENNDYDLNLHNNSFVDINPHFTHFEDLFRQMELTFSNDVENSSDIFVFPPHVKSDVFNEPLNENDSKIPKQNFLAQKHFLNSGLPQRTSSEHPAKITISPKFNFEKANSRSYYFGMHNGRKIEKEVCTRQLPDGVTEKVIVLKDGDQQCITTITENLKSGLQNYNKELFNLDESQLNEFENRFSKFRL